jgi:hypothetical protein
VEIKIGKIVASENGQDGVRVEGNVQLSIGDLHTERNGGQGLNIRAPAPLLEKLGLPKDIDPLELAQLLQSLQSLPMESRTRAVEQSGLLAKAGRVVVDSSTLIANVIAIASNPNVSTIIKLLRNVI